MFSQVEECDNLQRFIITFLHTSVNMSPYIRMSLKYDILCILKYHIYGSDLTSCSSTMRFIVILDFIHRNSMCIGLTMYMLIPIINIFTLIQKYNLWANVIEQSWKVQIPVIGY